MCTIEAIRTSWEDTYFAFKDLYCYIWDKEYEKQAENVENEFNFPLIDRLVYDSLGFSSSDLKRVFENYPGKCDSFDSDGECKICEEILVKIRSI